MFTLLARNAFRNSNVVANWATTVAILFDYLCKILIFIKGHLPSLDEGLDSIERLGNGRGYTIFKEVNGGVDVVDINVPSIKLWRLFNTFFVARPFVTFKCCNVSSHCNVAFSNPSSFEVLVLSSFDMYHSLSFKVYQNKF
jgi:hypothetical protein